MPSTPPPDPSKPKVRSEGQRLLVAVPEKSTDIAAQLGVSKVTVGEWRAGKKVPKPDARRLLLAHYQIAPRAWDQLPGVIASTSIDELVETVKPERRRVASAPNSDVVDDPLADVNELIRECKQGMKLGGILPVEKASWQERLLKALAHKQKILDTADVRDDKIIRHNPRWQFVKQRIAEALTPFPAAAQAVADALAELDA